jgi:hypothetical protein
MINSAWIYIIALFKIVLQNILFVLHYSILIYYSYLTKRNIIKLYRLVLKLRMLGPMNQIISSFFVTQFWDTKYIIGHRKPKTEVYHRPYNLAVSCSFGHFFLFLFYFLMKGPYITFSVPLASISILSFTTLKKISLC